MPTVTLLAQPYKKFPLVERKALEAGKYEVKRKGTFGVIWFTEFGAAVWESCMQTDGAARIRLKQASFDEMDWTVIFKVMDLNLRLTSIRYKGKGMGSPRKCYLKLELNSDDETDITTFVAKLKDNLKRNPMNFADPGALAAENDVTVEEVRQEWERVLGHMIEWKAEPAKDTGGRGKGAAEKTKKDPKVKPSRRKLGGLGGKLGSLASSLPLPGSEDKQSADEREADGEPEGEVLECPECGAEVAMPGPGEALKCPKCGLEGEAPERSEPLVFECPQCEGDIEIWTRELPEMLECPHCGASGSLGGEDDRETAAPDDETKADKEPQAEEKKE